MSDNNTKFDYHSKTKIELHPQIVQLVRATKKSQPYMPPQLIRKIAEELGMDFNQQILNLMFSNICDYKIDGWMKTMREFKNTKKSMSCVTKNDVIKVLSLERVTYFNRTNIYPDFGEEQQQEINLENIANQKQQN